MYICTYLICVYIYMYIFDYNYIYYIWGFLKLGYLYIIHCNRIFHCKKNELSSYGGSPVYGDPVGEDPVETGCVESLAIFLWKTCG